MKTFSDFTIIFEKFLLILYSKIVDYEIVDMTKLKRKFNARIPYLIEVEVKRKLNTYLTHHPKVKLFNNKEFNFNDEEWRITLNLKLERLDTFEVDLLNEKEAFFILNYLVGGRRVFDLLFQNKQYEEGETRRDKFTSPVTGREMF